MSELPDADRVTVLCGVKLGPEYANICSDVHERISGEDQERPDRPGRSPFKTESILSFP